MIKRFRQVLNTKGLTMIELLVALFVFSVIAISVITVFVSAIGAYVRARDFAEVNSLMDSLSALIMDDVMSATATMTDIDPPDPFPGDYLFTIYTTHYIVYNIYPTATSDGVRVITRNGTPVLAANFYRSILLDEVTLDITDGIATLTLTVLPGGGAPQTRSYTARPVGLQLIE